MAEPEDLTLRLLRDIRSVLDKHTEMHTQHSREFETLRRDIHDWQETIATASGFSVHANLRNQALADEMADLRRRIESLEQLNRTP